MSRQTFLPLLYQEDGTIDLNKPFILLDYATSNIEIDKILQNENYTEIISVFQQKRYLIDKNNILGYNINYKIHIYNFNLLFKLNVNNGYKETIYNDFIYFYHEINNNSIVIGDYILVLNQYIKVLKFIKNKYKDPINQINDSNLNKIENIFNYNNPNNIQKNNSLRYINKDKLIELVSVINIKNLQSKSTIPSKNVSTINITKLINNRISNINKKKKIKNIKKNVSLLLNKRFNNNNTLLRIIKGGAKILNTPGTINQETFNKIKAIYELLKSNVNNQTFKSKINQYKNAEIQNMATKLKSTPGSISKQKLYKILELFYMMKKIYEKMPQNLSLLDTIYSTTITNITEYVNNFTTNGNPLFTIYGIKNSLIKNINLIKKNIDIHPKINEIVDKYIMIIESSFDTYITDCKSEIKKVRPQVITNIRHYVFNGTSYYYNYILVNSLISTIITKSKTIIGNIYYTIRTIIEIYDTGQIPSIRITNRSGNLPQVSVNKEVISSSSQPVQVTTVGVVKNSVYNVESRIVLVKIIKILYDLLPKKLQEKFKTKIKDIKSNLRNKNRYLNQSFINQNLDNVIKTFLK